MKSIRNYVHKFLHHGQVSVRHLYDNISLLEVALVFMFKFQPMGSSAQGKSLGFPSLIRILHLNEIFQRLEYFNIRAMGKLNTTLDNTVPDCHNSKSTDPTLPSMHTQCFH